MLQKKLRLPLFILFATLGVYACVLIPLLRYLINDIVLRSTLLLDGLDLLSRHFEIVGSILLLEFLIFLIYRYSLKEARPLFIIAACALAFKYVGTVIAYSIAFGSLDLTGGLTPYLVSLLLELAIAAIVIFFSVQFISPAKEMHAARKEAFQKLGKDFDEKDPCYPFDGLFSWKNPVVKTTLLSTLTVFLLQSAAFIVSFVSGAPLMAADIPVMLIYEALLILLPCAYAYFLALLFFKLCMKKSNQCEKETD